MMSIVIPIVKVKDSCAVDQFTNSSAMGDDSTLQAYIRPANNKAIVPTIAYTQRFNFFILFIVACY